MLFRQLVSSAARMGLGAASAGRTAAVSTSAKHDGLLKTLMDSDGKFHSHSSMLANSPTVYEVLTEQVEPKNWEDYLKHKEHFFQVIKECPGVELEHVASWNFIFGDPDIFKSLHLIKFKNGWSDLDKTRVAIRSDPVWLEEKKKGIGLIRQQGSEIFNSFSYWPEPDARTGGNIYDLRSYELKPGSMYDWARYWSTGLSYRQNVREDIPYCGLFSQIGQQNLVYHIWVYKDLSDRKACRTNTWANPEWNNIVANTVPLFRKLTTRILEPLPFSPTQ